MTGDPKVSDTLDLFFRAHTVPVTPQKVFGAKRRITQPTDALILRCAATNDEKKELLCGAYICPEREGAEYVTISTVARLTLTNSCRIKDFLTPFVAIPDRDS
jgi:hypothetical protein